MPADSIVKMPLARIHWIAFGVVIMVWLAMQFFFGLRTGIRTSVDSGMYVEYASHLFDGKLFSDRAIWYASYSTAIAVAKTLFGSINGIIVIQLAFSAVAMLCCYFIAFKIFENSFAGVIAALMYAAWPPIHEWNFFIYTDSLFASCSVILLALISYRDRVPFFVILGFGLFTLLLRPTGICHVIAAMALIAVISKKIFIPLAATFILAILAALVSGGPMFAGYDRLDGYVTGEVIYPKIRFLVTVPENLVLPSSEARGLQKILLFAFYNPLYFAKLFFTKFGLFFLNIKPYYSRLHNLAIMAFLYPIYVLAFNSFRKLKMTPEVIYAGVFILSNGVIVGLMSENYDGRFLIPVLPFIFVMASGIVKFQVSKSVS